MRFLYQRKSKMFFTQFDTFPQFVLPTKRLSILAVWTLFRYKH